MTTLVAFGIGSGVWRCVDDGVMGGSSRSRLRVTADQAHVFEGELSLENNGGFASARMELEPIDLSTCDGVAARVRGDGRRYQIRLRANDGFRGLAYRAPLEPSGSDWQVVEIPFSALTPTLRGRRPPGAPRLDTSRLSQIGFLIGEGQAGAFRLEIAWVRAYGSGPEF